MFRFFRSIRQKLLSNGKNRRYILYAIGEIFLVVIGILIALQINNWNEERKNRNYEKEILSEIYQGLIADSSRIKSWIEPRIEAKIDVIDSLLKYLYLVEIESLDADSLRAYYHRMSNSPLVTINFGPFETLKSNDLNKIKGQNLRFSLVDVYESVFPRQLSFINIVQEHNDYIIKDLRRKLEKRIIYRRGSGYYDILITISADSGDNEKLLELVTAHAEIAHTLNHRSGIIQETIHKTLISLRTYFIENGIKYDLKYSNSDTGVRGNLSDSTSLK